MTEQTPNPEDVEAKPAESQAPEEKAAESPTLDAAKDMAADVKAQVTAMDLKDRMILLGSLALFVLYFFPWWSMSVNVGGLSQSNSVNGFHGVAWLGWIAAAAAVLLMVSKTKILGKLPPAITILAQNSAILVVVTGIALLAGPIYFWSQTSGDVPSVGGLDAGKTFFFVLAFLGALVAAGGAVWKLVDEKKAATPE